jgi:hypothetical protein
MNYPHHDTYYPSSLSAGNDANWRPPRRPAPPSTKATGTGPTTYTLPGVLPAAPTKMDEPTGGTNDEQTASQPEASARQVRLPDEFDDSEDDGRSESSDIEIMLKKETKKQRNECMARNKKIETKRAAVVEENVRKKQVYEDSRPGCIPDGLGVILIGSRHERDNSFWNTLGRHFYYSGLNNCVYAGKTAATAADYEGRYNTAYGPTMTRRLYSILPRGLPMNPHEVKRGGHVSPSRGIPPNCVSFHTGPS